MKGKGKPVELLDNLVCETKIFHVLPSMSVKDDDYKHFKASPRYEMHVPVLTNPGIIEVGERLVGSCDFLYSTRDVVSVAL